MLKALLIALIVLSLSFFSARAEGEEAGSDASDISNSGGAAAGGESAPVVPTPEEDDDEDDEDDDIDAEIDGAAPPAQPKLTPEQQEAQQAMQRAYVEFLMKNVSDGCKPELQAALQSQGAEFSPECDAELASVRASSLACAPRGALPVPHLPAPPTRAPLSPPRAAR